MARCDADGRCAPIEATVCPGLRPPCERGGDAECRTFMEWLAQACSAQGLPDEDGLGRGFAADPGSELLRRQWMHASHGERRDVALWLTDTVQWEAATAPEYPVTWEALRKGSEYAWQRAGEVLARLDEDEAT